MTYETYKSEFACGDVIILDGEPDIHAKVTGLLWEGQDSDHHQVRIAWIHNGNHYEIWVGAYRVKMLHKAN